MYTVLLFKSGRHLCKGSIETGTTCNFEHCIYWQLLLPYKIIKALSMTRFVYYNTYFDFLDYR